MAVQSLSSIGTYVPDPFSSSQSTGANRSNSPFSDYSGQQLTPSSRSVGLSAEYYSSDTMSLQFSNKDGDTVTLSMQHVEYAKTQIQVQDNGSMSDQDWQKIVDKIKDEYKALQSEIINKFIESTGGKTDQSQAIQQPQDPNAAAAAQNTQDAAVPDYWNAENTSQRIVDFATSFLKGFEGAGSDFLSKIKDAIEAGFKQAKDALGKLPDPISNLIQHTHDLVMSKLDAWAKEQGIAVDNGTADSSTIPVPQTPDTTAGSTDQPTQSNEQILETMAA
jgi:hypothetical protein